MREQGGGKCREKTERGKENIQEGSEKNTEKISYIHRKAGDGFEEKNIEICILQLVINSETYNVEFLLNAPPGGRECNWS